MKLLLVLLALAASVPAVMTQSAAVDQCSCGNCGGDRK